MFPAWRARAALALALGVWAAPVPAAGFPFSLHPERARYLLGEPVYLRMEGDGMRPPALEEGTLRLVIRGPDGGERVYRPPLRLRARPEAPGAATAPDGGAAGAPASGAPASGGPASGGPASGGRASGGAPAGIPASFPKVRYARLIAEGGGWVFPKPGRYVMRLRAPPAGEGGVPGQSHETEPLSDTVAVEIAAPTSPEDRRAYALLARAPEEYALAVYLEGGDQLQAGMAVLRGLASFPNGYARVAAFVLCSDWAQDFRARSGGAPRALDLGRALSFARFDKSAGAYLPLRTAYRLRQAMALQSVRVPEDPNLAAARARLRAFEASLTSEERAWLASF